MEEIADLKKQLNSFNREERVEALKKLKKLCPEPLEKTGFVNQHAHSFYSFNAYGYSPSCVAFEGYNKGLFSIGLVDFDTLDGVSEIIEAGEILGIRATAGIESRVFVSEYSEKVINSPGEKGVAYFMGVGFTEKEKKGTAGEKVINRFREISRERNIARLTAVNLQVDKTIGTVDYEADVLSLTPNGNATERHILEALDRKARAALKGKDLIEFWAKRLGEPVGKIQSLIGKSPDLQGLIRSRLFKAAGAAASYPVLDDVIKAIIDLGGIPVFAWLDGTSDGESDPAAILSLMQAKGVVAVNIVPDRNWNIKDKEERVKKVANLNAFINTAKTLGMPLIAGTEMNKFGQSITDNFNAGEIKNFLPDFIAGACFFYGHTLLSRLANCGFNSEWAKKKYPLISKRIEFYTEAGKKFEPGTKKEKLLQELGS
ncbi:MAG: hypothetical protein A2044_00280 [Candidatus Firestonebacteria bacterium GWA2_43_8]|nr:MAG: hypothetical protein A2044_00280 [Candidatus Firestonebacteria bacterium GWA2_43_8]